MRRIRKSVHIFVSSDFYDVLERERRKLVAANSKYGLTRNISFPEVTQIFAQKIHGGKIDLVKKQKRRRY
jgi:hypothetical protein